MANFRLFTLAECAYKNLNASSALWTQSGTNAEFYYTGTDLIEEPFHVMKNDTRMVAGALGSLATGEWAWGDNDTLGTSTIYVKVTEADPDSQYSGFITCTEPVELDQSAIGGNTFLSGVSIVNYSGEDITMTLGRYASSNNALQSYILPEMVLGNKEGLQVGASIILTTDTRLRLHTTHKLVSMDISGTEL